MNKKMNTQKIEQIMKDRFYYLQTLVNDKHSTIEEIHQASLDYNQICKLFLIASRKEVK